MKKDELITLEGARRIIRDLNGLNLEKISFAVIKKKLSPMLCTEFGADMMPEERHFFRANIVGEGRPTNATRLSYPPSEFIINYQRCNSPGQPVFYCAIDPVTACSEIRAKVGDIVYLSTWEVVHPFLSITLNAGVSYNPAADVVATFIESKFLQEIHETFSYQYKMTSAISEILFSHSHEMIPHNNAYHNEKIPYGPCTISFPSAANSFHKRCYAIKTIAADNCLKLASVQEVRIDEIEDSGLKSTITGRSLRIDEEGNIEWDAEYEKGKKL